MAEKGVEEQVLAMERLRCYFVKSRWIWYLIRSISYTFEKAAAKEYMFLSGCFS